MARWKVTAKHYIHAEQYGQPTEWERQETNQATQRMFRKAYKVPLFIDPEDPHCVNKEGICVVARKGTEKDGDIIFEGPPTPDMEPLDPQAQAETDSEKPKWVHPIDGLEPMIGQEFGKQLLQMFERQLDAAGRPSAVSLKGTSSAEIQELKDMILAQQRQIQQLLGANKALPVDETDQELLEMKRPQVDPLPIDPDPDTPPAPPPIKVNHPRPTARRM